MGGREVGEGGHREAVSVKRSGVGVNVDGRRIVGAAGING